MSKIDLSRKDRESYYNSIEGSSSVSSSRCIGEENNEDQSLTGMLLGLQELEEQLFATTTYSSDTSQLRSSSVPSIKSDIIGGDITLENIQLAKQELINQKIDLNKDVNDSQKLLYWVVDVNKSQKLLYWVVTPLIHFCKKGNLLIVRLLCLIGADCTQLCKNHVWFPMLAAADGGHLDICQWLFENGGDDANYQINKETSSGNTPLRASHAAWCHGRDNEGKTCCWLLQNGGGQHLSSKALRYLGIDSKEEMNSNLLVRWMRKNMQLHDTFILFLCGATTITSATSTSSLLEPHQERSLQILSGQPGIMDVIGDYILFLCGTATMTTSSSSSSSSLSSSPDDGGTRKHKHTHTRQRKIHPERSLQNLDGHPGIMELIGDYIGLLRGKEFRMLKEFNELVIEYIDTDESSM